MTSIASCIQEKGEEARGSDAGKREAAEMKGEKVYCKGS